MSLHEHKLLRCAQLCESSKTTDRKKGMRELFDLLATPEAIQILNTNKDGDRVNWSALFHAAHRCLVNESEKLLAVEKKGTTKTVNSQENAKYFYGSVVGTIVRKGKNINCDYIMAACFQVFKDHFLRKCYCQYYIPILQCVLSNRNYWMLINYDQWKQLLESLLDILKDKDKSHEWITNDVLILLELVIKHGCLQSYLGLDVKHKLVQFLEINFSDLAVASSETALLSLTVCVCREISKESRTGVCHLGETLLNAIIDKYETKCDVSSNYKNNLIIEFMTIQVKCHHPKGSRQGKEGAYALCWSTWNRHLSAMYRLVINSVHRLKGYVDLSLFSTVLLDLCVALCNQLFENQNLNNDVTIFAESMSCSAPKKRKVTVGLHGIMDELGSCGYDTSCWPWLLLISELLLVHPQFFQDSDVSQLLDQLWKLQCTSKEPIVMACVCRCSESLIEVMNSRKMKSNLWLKIWENTLRTVGLNQNENDSHSLIRALLSKLKVPISCMENLLKMFQSSMIRMSPHSLKTLSCLLSHFSLPRSPENFDALGSLPSWTQPLGDVRMLLLEWVLPFSTDASSNIATLSSDILASISVMLTLRAQSENQRINIESPRITCAPVVHRTDFETDYFISTFDGGLLFNAEVSEAVIQKSVIRNSSLSNVVDVRLQQKLFELLLARFSYLEQEFDSLAAADNSASSQRRSSLSGRMKSKSDLSLHILDHVCLVSCILSNMITYGSIKEDSLRSCDLIGPLGRSMTCLSELVKEILQPVESEQSIVSDVESAKRLLSSLLKLYEVQLSMPVCLLLRVLSPTNVIVPVVNIFTTFLDCDEDDQAEDSNDSRTASNKKGSLKHPSQLMDCSQLDDVDQIHLMCVHVLTLYSCPSQNATFCSKQDTILERLLQSFQNSKLFDISLPATFAMITQSLCIILNCVNLNGEKHLWTIIEIVQALCRKWNQDAEASSYILLLIKGLIKHVQNRDKHHRESTMLLIRPFVKKRFGSIFTVELISIFEEIVKVDRYSQWAAWKFGTHLSLLLDRDDLPPEAAEDLKDVNGCTAMAEELVFFLNSPFHEIRLTAIKVVGKLFFNRTSNFHWEWVFFNRVRAVLNSLFCIEEEDKMTTEEESDEILNRTASVLHMLSAIIGLSTQCSRPALLCLMRFVKEKNLNLELVTKVFNLLPEAMKMKTIDKFLQRNLPHVLDAWFEWGFSIQDFPFKVMGFLTLPHFLESCLECILPIVLRRDLSAASDVITSKLKTNESTILQTAFPAIFAQYLPFIETDGLHNPSVKLQYDKLLNTLGNETIMRLLSSKLKLILVELLRLLQDSIHFERLLGLNRVWPASKLPCISFENFLSALKYLQNSAETNEELLEYIGIHRPSIIQHVLLQLRADVCAPVMMYQRLLSLHQYCAFSDVLSSHIEQGKLNGIAEFVVRDVSHTLLYLIRDYRHDPILSDISLSSCRYLKKMYEHVLPSHVGVVSRFLPTVVGILLPIAQMEGPLSDASFALLEFLIVNHHEEMAEAVGQLPPFPEDPIFREMREIHTKTKYGDEDFDLQKEILHFLHSAKRNSGFTDWRCMLEGLRFLRQQLSEKKNELLALFETLEKIRGFSEDCAESVLHQLVCTLIHLGSSSDSQVQLEAGRCLGELGPADLTTLVLKPAEDHMKLAGNSSNALFLVIASVARLLANYLLDADSSVVQAAGQALYAVLSTVQAESLFDSTNQVLEKENVSPFIPSKGSKRKATLTKDTNKIISMCHSEIWCPHEDVAHKTWISGLVSALLVSFSDEDSFFRLLLPVVDVQTSFAESMLPVLLNLAVNYSENVREQVSQRIALFFSNHCGFVSSMELSQTSVSGSGTNIYLNKVSVQCMINSVNFIHYHKTISKNDGVSLDVNYLHVAQAAQYCSAYFSSIMYAELWCSEDDRWMKVSRCSNVAPVDEICENDQENGTVLQGLLREAYQQIGDHDALFGCGSSVFLNAATRVKYYERVGMWNNVLLNYDVMLRHSNCPSTTTGLVKALQQSGLLGLTRMFLSSLPAEWKEPLQSAQFECMWRMGQWESSISSKNEECEFEQCRFFSLKSVHDGDKVGACEAVDKGRLAVLSHLGSASLESCNIIYNALASLQSLQEIEDIISCNNVKAVLSKWSAHYVLPQSDFLLFESIAAQRARVLESTVSHSSWHENSNEHKSIMQTLIDLRLLTAKLAREEGKLEIAVLWLHSLAAMPALPKQCQWELSFEESQLAWSWGKGAVDVTTIACQQLRSLLKELKSTTNDSEAKVDLHARALCLYGLWMAESCSESPQFIIENYMKEALIILNKSSTNHAKQTKLQVHCHLARFADLEYQRINDYIKSETFQRKQLVMEELSRNAEIEADRKNANLQSKSSVIDKEEIENTLKEQDQFVQLAMRHYLEALSFGEEDKNLSVFRIVSIWFENGSHENILKLVDIYLNKIQSHKFVVLLPQIAARIGDSKNALSKSVNNLLKRCAAEHPHHTLPFVLALANSYKDLKTADGASKSASDERVVAASHILSGLRKSAVVSNIVIEMEKTASALISLAYCDANENKSYIVPKGEPIRRLQGLEHAMVPILSLPVRCDGRYESIIGIQSFDHSFSVANGITKPKKINCVCTDGVKRPILVKGRDDLRQDAVMQQVFGIMNTLFKRCKETKRRKLTIRTYKVVPLTQRCGILEWCEGTSPLGEILLNLHGKYYPGGYTPAGCRNKIDNVRNKSHTERLNAYLEVCKNFHPAFRFFFTETYPTPAEWFEHRLAYVHSASTNSMVGYILGLGDRHVQNILVDKNTAEFVHIDFGIAFELGRILPTPETVPFRLTRDVEDGMGVSGIEGVFRRSCEKTMTVLRKNQEIILTLLEVLLYDPLYVWTTTPKKVVNRQKGVKSSKESKSEESESSQEKKNKMAERALSRLKQKLQGTEEGAASSVEGQVNRLIQQARDPSNLSRLFGGWQAYF